MSIDVPPRPAPKVVEGAHVHDRTCWWDLTECRWAGPAHPPPRRADVPASRGAADSRP